MPAIAPSLVLAVLIGVFASALYVLVRGRTLAPIGFVGVAAVLGAWAGDAVGGLAGFTLVSLGDFHVLAAFGGALLGIAILEILSVLGAPRPGAE
jgi:outer membrane lipoprotein SlyB